MGARFRSWWQQIKQHSFIATGIIVALLVLIVFIFSAYRFGWSGTGFLNKTLWDWLQLLIIPLALAVIALVFQLANSRTERQIAKERYEQDQQIALDKQHEELLQAYLDRMSELLLEKGLRTSQADAEVRNVARTRTISVLRQLDAVRVGDVFTFLIEARLMETPEPIVRLGDANLSKVNWSEADLTDANLSVANLSGANLSNTFLEKADLSNADLEGADLSNAHVWGANLSGAGLMEANLSGADLSTIDLRSADLTAAKLIAADLSNADLSNAKVTEEQLKTAQSLKGATMPDGSIHS